MEEDFLLEELDLPDHKMPAGIRTVFFIASAATLVFLGFLGFCVVDFLRSGWCAMTP